MPTPEEDDLVTKHPRRRERTVSISKTSKTEKVNGTRIYALGLTDKALRRNINRYGPKTLVGIALRRELDARRDAKAREHEEKKRRALERAMKTAPGASTAHRGKDSIWNTADPTTVRREPDAPAERVSDGKRHPVTIRRSLDG